MEWSHPHLWPQNFVAVRLMESWRISFHHHKLLVIVKLLPTTQMPLGKAVTRACKVDFVNLLVNVCHFVATLWMHLSSAELSISQMWTILDPVLQPSTEQVQFFCIFVYVLPVAVPFSLAVFFFLVHEPGDSESVEWGAATGSIRHRPLPTRTWFMTWKSDWMVPSKSCWTTKICFSRRRRETLPQIQNAPYRWSGWVSPGTLTEPLTWHWMVLTLVSKDDDFGIKAPPVLNGLAPSP